MKQTHYLIAGASHAGLEAVHAIRLVDPDSTITIINRDSQPPYSPTILPYVVSGHSKPDQVVLRSDDYFTQHNITLVSGDQVVGLNADSNTVTLASGDQWQYEKLLLATGADPIIPPIKGINDVTYHVLRTMKDATDLRDDAQQAKTAVVLGAGLIGMHGAENLKHANLDVTVVEMCDQVLPGYFDTEAAGMIEATFVDNGITMSMNSQVVEVASEGNGCKVTLANGDSLQADLLLVATGVKPDLDYLTGSGMESDNGILVDDQMRTSIDNIWAAGDVAQGRDFFSDKKVMTGILPDAVEQGRTAAMDMAEDSAAKPYQGGVPINTYSFFGRQAISVGQCIAAAGQQEETAKDSVKQSYRKILIKDNQLQGISCINEEMDAGIMWQLILRKVDLTPVRDNFIAAPLKTGRTLMSSIWR